MSSTALNVARNGLFSAVEGSSMASLRRAGQARISSLPQRLSKRRAGILHPLRISSLRRLSTTTTTADSQSSSPTSSVSASEVSHFSRLASSWWDPHGPSRLLHLMNPLRHDFIRSCLQQSSLTTTNDEVKKEEEEKEEGKDKKYTYLDIGCGGGIFASSAARLPSTSHVTAIDPTPEVIAVARSHARRDPTLSPQAGKLEYINCAIEDLSANKNTTQESYDIVTLFEVLEHISSPAAFLSTALAHLRPGGWVIGSTIARHPLSYITTKLVAEAPVVGVVPPGTHDWNQYINPDELRGYFESESQTGMWGEVVIQGVVYVPGLGWKFVKGSEGYGNYFFGVQKLAGSG